MASQPISSADAGTISLILDLIGDTLTPAQRTAIAAELTALRPEGVHPGDLITAELFNDMQSKINDLLIRMAALEGTSGGPVITGITPSTTPILTNTTMSILGTGFDIEPNRNVVRLGEATITQFQAGTGKNRLTFSVPDLFTGLPKSVNAVVETGGKRSNTFAVSLDKAPRQQTGEFDITIISAPTQVLATGQVLTFEFDVHADTGLSDELRFQLNVANAQGATQSDWRATAAFLPPTPHTVQPGDNVRVTVTVTAPSGATRANLILRVLGIGEQAIGVSPPLTWAVGGTFAPSNPLARIDFAVPGIASPFKIVDNVEVDGITYDKGIQAPVGRDALVNFTLNDVRTTHASAATNAAYNYTTEIEPNATSWAITQGPTPAQHTAVVSGTTKSTAIRLKNNSGTVGATTLLRMYANQSTASGSLQAFKSYVVIPLILIA